MSFNFSFVARDANAARNIVAKEYAPGAVKAFIEQALLGVPTGVAVRVKAVGHQFDGGGSYCVSTATVEVEPISFRSE